MVVNWIAIGVVIVLAFILVLFLIKRNLKDEKKYETFLNKKDSPTEEDKDEEELNNYL